MAINRVERELRKIISATQRSRRTDVLLLPHSEQLIEKEREALKAFFGKDIAVPEPPVELFQTLENMLGLGITGFEPHFLPQVSLTEEDKLPGWKVKPSSWLWEEIKECNISTDASGLKEGWYLVDRRRKPRYDNGNQRYNNDYFESIMQELRKTGKIQEYSFVPTTSRFGASPAEIEQVILPEFARTVDTRGEAANKTYMQFNVWGNMYYPEWGKTTTLEWFVDRSDDYVCLCGGRSDGGGLAHVSSSLWPGERRDFIAFSPVIRFLSKPR